MPGMSLLLPSTLFFLSGLSALAYELAWVSRLELALGGSSLAIGIVLAAYMAGLGGGAILFGRWADRPGEPARRYAFLEFGIGAWGLLAPWIHAGLDSVYGASGGAGGLLLRAMLSLLALAPATLLMGGTLPVILRGLVRASEDTQRVAASLYGWNTLGAVAGTLLAEWLLLPRLGLAGTSRAVALLNIGLGLWALRAGPRLAAGVDEAPRSPAKPVRPNALLLAVAGGFLALCLEVAWSRALGMALGSTRHAFAAVLAAMLLGIGLGSLVARRLIRPLASAVWALVLAAAHALLFLFLFPRILELVYLVTQARVLSYEALLAFLWVICGLSVLPGAMAFGALLPIAIRVDADDVAHAGSSSGRIYLANTVAAVAGSLLASWLLLPWLGTDGSIRWAGLCALAVGMLLLGRTSHSWANTARAVAAALALLLFVWPSWPRERLDLNPTRLRHVTQSREPGDYPARFVGSGTAQLFAQEGRNAFVSVRANGRIKQLKIGGKTDGSTPNDMPTQLLLGTVPFLARPDARRACVVGFGTGVTARVAADFPSVRDVDVIEIESKVVEAAAAHFSAENDGVATRVDVRIVLDDARAHFRAASLAEPYDVIISEPSNPSIAGIANLFTRENYANAKRLLSEDGCYLQWVQLYETDLWMLRSMVRTFAASFEHVDIWWAYPNDLLLLGSDSALRYDREKSATAVLGNARLNADLWPYLYARSPDDLYSRYLGSAAQLSDLFESGDILHDDHPRLAAAAARNRYAPRLPFALLRELWQRYLLRDDKWPPLDGPLRPDELQTHNLLVAGARYLGPVTPDLAQAFLEGIENPEAWALRARHASSPAERQSYLAQGLELYPTHPLLFVELARLHIDAGDRELARRILDQIRLPEEWESADLSVQRLRLIPADSDSNARLITEHCRQGLELLMPREEAAETQSYLLGRLVAAATYDEEALKLLRERYREQPYDGTAGLAFAEAYLQRNQPYDCLRILDEVALDANMEFDTGLRVLRIRAMSRVSHPALIGELDDLLADHPDLVRHPDLQALLRARAGIGGAMR